MSSKNQLTFIGSAFGIGAGNSGCADGPYFLKDYFSKKQCLNFPYIWRSMISLKQDISTDHNQYQQITDLCQQVAKQTYELFKKGHFLANIGGDHSCAIGFWSGIMHAIPSKDNIGVVWIDAHMDAHTTETSPSGNIHGMPVASLLGFGDKRLRTILNDNAKIKPENICLVGIRSYEKEEAEFLEKLGVKVYDINCVEQIGINQALTKAIDHVSRNNIGVGISLDLDALDPLHAPGVGTPVENGICGQTFIEALAELRFHKPLLALEIAEYNPHLDSENKTAELIVKFLNAIYQYIN